MGRLRFLKHHNNCSNDLYSVFPVCYKTVTTDRNGLRTKKNLELTASKSLICFVIWMSSKGFKFDYFDMKFLSTLKINRLLWLEQIGISSTLEYLERLFSEVSQYSSNNHISGLF